MKKVIFPLPTYGFDPTEAAIPWKLLSGAGFEVAFATPDGQKASPDNNMLNGHNLGIWRPVLQARKDAIEACKDMQSSPEFCNPITYDDIQENAFDALLLPGGHDKGMKEYLESQTLQALVVDFFIRKKPVGAICHGVVLAARSIDKTTKKSIIHDYKTTALLKDQELLAFNLTRLWLGDYYLTYPETTVEDEVTSVLSDAANFITGPSPLFRDKADNLKRGFCVRDRNYLSARWPGDAYNFSLEFIQMLKSA